MAISAEEKCFIFLSHSNSIIIYDDGKFLFPLSLSLFLHCESKSDNKPSQRVSIHFCIFPTQLTLDLWGKGAGTRDSRAGGAAGALALLPDELAGEPSQSDQYLHHGTWEPR